MPNRIEELFAELAESVSGFGDELTQQGRIGREYEDLEKERLVEGLYKNDPAVLAALGTLATLPVSLPVQAPAWLTRAGIASKVPGLNKSYGAVGGDMVSQTLKAIEQVTGRSGARVNTDVAGRVPLPKIKDPVVTKQGPRGPINIDSPNQMPLPLSGGRNTGGISATERAQLPSSGIPSTTTGRSTKSYMDNVRQTKLTEQQTNRLKFLEDELRIDQAKINAGEAPSKNFNKMLEEAARLRQLLKQ